MSTRGTTVKRILKEASELSASPSPDFTAAPLETDLFEWHFTIRGPPAPSAFSDGVYHGRIRLPPSYPLRPPSFRFLTPSGRFEVNREICLSISGFHEETWQPAWGIRTALVAIRSFMDSDAGGAVGAMNAAEEVRRRLAGESGGWTCRECGRSNDQIMVEQEGLCREMGGGKEGKVADVVPEELRLGYRDEMTGKKEGEEQKEVLETDAVVADEGAALETGPKDQNPVDLQSPETPTRAVRAPRAVPARMPIRRSVAVIVATAGALAFMIIRFLFF
ncbi:UBC-like protein [Myriangium duriaei CBS 260.36]|uniref:UBC-like protein n=1 Tax=Myriangium duriaei CBS 260.36 TaxID=1168546 RepID=A0A9P4MC06_9PEZI|nr:UBC-like protein [Myriangium duriaei CBS 260.36]